MRRVLQVCGVAAVLTALVSVDVPATGAQGIVSGITVPPISAVTPGMPVEIAVAVPSLVSSPIMPGIGAGLASAGSGGKGHVTRTETRTSEPATIELSE